MATTPLPRTGEVYLDARSAERAMRVTWHDEAGVVVLSLWRGNVCVSTFQLAVEDVPALVEALSRRGPAARLSDAG